MTELACPPDSQTRREIVSQRKLNVFVQASAGTGKTTLIVDRVHSLVLDGIPIERLAVVTFTRAAAAELRSRIREKLLAGRAMGEESCARALKAIPGAWISTIHRFAGRILREYFNLTGVDPSFTTVEGHFTPLEIRRIWDEWLLQGESEFTGFQRVLVETSTGLQNEYALQMEKLRWLESLCMVGGRSAAKTLLDNYMSKHVPIIQSNLSLCRDRSDKLFGVAERALELLSHLGRNIENSDYAVPGKILSVLSTNCGKADNWEDLRMVKACMKSAKEDFTEIAESVKSGVLTEQTWGFAGDFASLLRSRWDCDRSRLSFSDLLFMAWKAVSEKRNLSSALAEKFDHILIDEFQDTSLDQVRLFNSFLEEAGRLPDGRVTIVADDKQSIYGWRNADIETFRRFRNRMEEAGSLCRTVTTNFRSTASIVRFVNGFGGCLFEGQTPEEEQFGCEYSLIEPCPGADQGHRVLVVSLPDSKELCKDGSGGAARGAQLQARWFADFVDGGIGSGHSPGDYALLFRAGTHVHRFVEELENRGIPYYVDARRDFRKRQEIIDLREMIRCLLNPDDVQAWLHVLRSGFFGISDLEIHRALSEGNRGYQSDDDSSPVGMAGEELKFLREALLRLPLADFIYALYFQTELVSSIAAFEYARTRQLGNLQYVFDMVLSGEIDSPGMLMELLDEDLSPTITEEPSTVPAEGGAVTITTVHRAKGLAWKHVVLAAPSDHPAGSRSSSLISYDHERKAALNLKVPIGRNKLALKTPFWKYISNRNAARDKAELRRLLYVAVTRPRESLVIFCHRMHKMNNTPGSTLWFSLQSALEREPGLFDIEELNPVEDETEKSYHEKPLELLKESTSDGTGRIFLAELEPVRWKPRGPRIGDLVHGVMEKIDLSHPSGWFERNDSFLRDLCGEDFTEVRDLALVFFEMDLPFNLQEATVVGREYPCIRRTQGGFRSQYIDLLLRAGEEMIVLDFKTDSFGGRSVKIAAEEYLKKQKLYIQDISECFNLRTRGFLVFLREGMCFEVE